VKKMVQHMVMSSRIGRDCYIPAFQKDVGELTSKKLTNVVREAAWPLSNPFWVNYWKQLEVDRRELREVEVFYYSPQLLGCIDTLVAEVSRDMSKSWACTSDEIVKASLWWQTPGRKVGLDKAVIDMWTSTGTS